ncbi:MAG: hypothetical protein ACXW4B_09725 [Micavibrio sp.]
MMVPVNISSQRGSALVYILIAIALLAALTVSFMEPSGQQTQSQNTFKLTSELESQIEFIRTNVQECVVLHSGGDSGIDHTTGAPPLAYSIGANKAFPLDPRSTRLTTPSTEPNALVRELRCPGNPGDDPVTQTPNPNHQPIFAGSSGKFMPPPPALFGEWQWYNGLDGVFFWIASDNTDAYITTALDKLDDQFGECEADVITAGGSAVALDNAADVLCPANSTCFRLWMITHTASTIDPDPSEPSIYPNEPGCP